MRILLIALLFPLFCSAQIDNKTSFIIQDSVPGTSITLKNRYVIFQKVFSSALKKQDLIEQLNLLLTSTRDFKFNKTYSENHWTGSLRNHVMYRDITLPLFGTTKDVPFLLDAKVIIQIKDFKYRVTVSEIILKGDKTADGKAPVDTVLDDYLTIKNHSKISTGKSYINLAKDLDNDFSRLFALENSLLSEQF